MKRQMREKEAASIFQSLGKKFQVEFSYGTIPTIGFFITSFSTYWPGPDDPVITWQTARLILCSVSGALFCMKLSPFTKNKHLTVGRIQQGCKGNL